MEHNNLKSPDSPSTTALTEDEARTVFATEVGPRMVGGIYHSAYWGTAYRVAGIHYGPAALIAMGWDVGWAITVQDHRGVRTKDDAWDSTQGSDKRIAVPAADAYRVAHGACTLRYYRNYGAARAHVTALLRRESSGRWPLAWVADDAENPSSPMEAHLLGRRSRPEPTGYLLTPLTLADHYDPAADE